MGKKYKIEYDDDDRSLYQLLADAVAQGIIVEPLNFDDYIDDDRRVNVFRGAGQILKGIFNEAGQNVDVQKDTDTIGGEITVSLNDISLSGLELEGFLRAVCSANSVEFSAFTDGHTEIGLIYRDLQIKRNDAHEN